MTIARPAAERFVAKVKIDEATGCWLWTAARYPGGYGAFGVSREGRRWGMVSAHRWSYEHHVGPIPAGLDLDHTCHNEAPDCPGGNDCVHRRCVNPSHLEPVTRRVNTLRGRSLAAANVLKSHCPANHPYDAANTYVGPNGYRRCRACSEVRNLRTTVRRRAERLAVRVALKRAS